MRDNGMPLYTSLSSGVTGLVAYTEVLVHYVLNLVHSSDYVPTPTPSVFKV